MNTPGYDVTEHNWFTAPADLWPLIQDWIMRRREMARLGLVPRK